MPELNPRDRLQPFLLDRLTDDEPANTKESRDKQVFSPRQLRGAILRDLGWLFNSPGPIEGDGISEFPSVAASVLNYGIPDLTGMTATGVNNAGLERAFTRAIKLFEPRLAPQSVVVRILDAPDPHNPNTIGLEIKGEVVATNMPEPLYIKTEVDLETGQMKLKDASSG